jgi:hypothetical protein
MCSPWVAYETSSRCLKPNSCLIDQQLRRAEESGRAIDIWFRPKQRDEVAPAAFIQTVSERHFLVALRLYGNPGTGD